MLEEIELIEARREELVKKKGEYEIRLAGALADKDKDPQVLAYIQDTIHKLAVINVLLRSNKVNVDSATKEIAERGGGINVRLLPHAFEAIKAVNTGDYSRVRQAPVFNEDESKPADVQFIAAEGGPGLGETKVPEPKSHTPVGESETKVPASSPVSSDGPETKVRELKPTADQIPETPVTPIGRRSPTGRMVPAYRTPPRRTLETLEAEQRAQAKQPLRIRVWKLLKHWFNVK